MLDFMSPAAKIIENGLSFLTQICRRRLLFSPSIFYQQQNCLLVSRSSADNDHCCAANVYQSRRRAAKWENLLSYWVIVLPLSWIDCKLGVTLCFHRWDTALAGFLFNFEYCLCLSSLSTTFTSQGCWVMMLMLMINQWKTTTRPTGSEVMRQTGKTLTWEMWRDEAGASQVETIGVSVSELTFSNLEPGFCN